MSKRKEKDLDMLYERRVFLDQTRINLANSFDKYLLSFATGSLYLSILFTNTLSNELLYKKVLATGWFALAFSVVMAMLSIISSVYAYDRQIEITDSTIKALNNDEDLIGRKNCWNKILQVLQWVAIIFFVLGIAMLSFFYFKNL